VIIAFAVMFIGLVEAVRTLVGRSGLEEPSNTVGAIP